MKFNTFTYFLDSYYYDYPVPFFLHCFLSFFLVLPPDMHSAAITAITVSELERFS